METIVTLLSWFLLAIGGFCVLVGGIGILRMPSFYPRVHAASLTDTMGTIALFLGLLLHSGLTLATVKLFAILLFLLLTGPAATYALVNAALMSGMRPDAPLLDGTGEHPKGDGEPGS